MFRNKERTDISTFRDFEPPLAVQRETKEEAIISPARLVSAFLAFILAMLAFQSLETNDGASSATLVLATTSLVCLIVFICGRGLDWKLF